MASAKHRRTKKHSKGERVSVRPVKVEVSYAEKMINKLASWKKGQNPWITIPNTLKDPCSLWVRRRANDIYGSPKNSSYNIFGKQES